MTMSRPLPTRRKVLLLYPRFNGGSFWNLRETCDMVGAKYPAPPLGLITVAALLPSTWDVRLIDHNIVELHDEDLLWADLVMIGSMISQQWEALKLIDRCHDLGLTVVVGGPDPTSSPHAYAKADFLVLGEVEPVIGDFIAAVESGAKSGTYVAEKFTHDVTTTPIPRFELLDNTAYLQVAVQFSRGCPFTCEFCDIIELYGRKPRAKTNAQMLAELQALYDTGYRGNVDFVDDNLIGNKKAVRRFLVDLLEWQKAHNFPFLFSTEASLNLADDGDLMDIMTRCGFFVVFVGIESPDPDVLNATRKKQNTRRSIVESVHRIQQAGLLVLAGFIFGFDDEKPGSAREMIALIEDAGIPTAMVGLLYALPNTQLTRRLTAEGRLHEGHDINDEGGCDQCISGLNFDTIRPRVDILRDYRTVLDTIYQPAAYMNRLNRAVDRLDLSRGRFFSAALATDLRLFARLAWNITLRNPRNRGYFWRILLGALFTDPRRIQPAIKIFSLFLHIGPYAEFVVSEIDRQLATSTGTAADPRPAPIKAAISA